MIEFSEKALAYIDILGFKELISFAEKKLKDPIPLIKHLERALGTFSCKYKIPRAQFKIKLFSDCISISTDLNPLSILKLIAVSASIQRELFMNDIQVRGAISKGKHFENETMIFSKALINALNIEQNYAIYPRIVIDRKLLKFLPQRQVIEFKSKHGTAFILKDIDGYFFVDYLDNIFFILASTEDKMIQTVLIHALERHRYYILQYSKDIKKNTDTGKKYLWAANYHNRKIIESSLEQQIKQKLLIGKLPDSF
jgi:hypothetical protein